MNIKRLALLLIVGMVMATMLAITIMPGVALGQTGATPGPTPTPTPAATNNAGATASPSASSSSSGSSPGSSSGSGTTATGAEVMLFGVAGAGLIAAGYFLTRKARV